MKPLKEFTIPFVGLKIGKHHFEYEIEQTFFEYFEYEDFNNVNIKVDVALEKKATLLELHFKISGFVNINCDLTNEPYNQIIENEKTYELSFDYNGKNIYSTTYVPAQKEVSISANSIAVEKIELGTMPSFTATDPIQLTWDNSENDYYYVVIVSYCRYG